MTRCESGRFAVNEEVIAQYFKVSIMLFYTTLLGAAI